MTGKGYKLILITLLVAFLYAGCAVKRTTIPPLAAGPIDFIPIKVERFQLENGLTILFYKDDELPLVYGSIYFPGGQIWEREGADGAVAAMGEEMRLGGAGNYSGRELDKKLESLGAGIGSSFSAETGSVTFNCGKSDLSNIFSLFSDVIRRPRFEQGRLDLWKSQNIDEIRRRKEDPETVATIVFTELLYEGSNYGRITTSDGIKKLTRENLVDEYRRFVKPNGAILTIIGNTTKEEILQLSEKHLGLWPSAKNNKPLIPPPIPNEPKAGIYFVESPLKQSTVEMGQLGVPRLTPDYHAIEVFNSIFGSSRFGSRLMTRVREDLGLTYGIIGSINPGVVRGTNLIGFQTKTHSTIEAILESLTVLKSLQKSLVGNDELSESKRVITNSFIFRLDTPEKALQRMALQELLSYPKDYDATFLPKLNGVTAVDVQNVAISKWDISKFVILVVGDSIAYSSLEELLKNPPEYLKGFSLTKVKFDEHLVK